MHGEQHSSARRPEKQTFNEFQFKNKSLMWVNDVPDDATEFVIEYDKNQWAFFPLPFAYFYLETCDPESHVPFLKNKICGIYLSFNWLKYTFNVGCHKSFQ